MADRDELIADVQAWLLRMPLNPGQLQQRAEEIVDGGIDRGGGRRIAIIEEAGRDETRNAFQRHLRNSECEWCHEAAARIDRSYRIVTPNPEES